MHVLQKQDLVFNQTNLFEEKIMSDFARKNQDSKIDKSKDKPENKEFPNRETKERECPPGDDKCSD